MNTLSNSPVLEPSPIGSRLGSALGAFWVAEMALTASFRPGSRSTGNSAFTTGKKPTLRAVRTCTSGLVRYSMSAAAPFGSGAPLGMARPTSTGM